MELEKKYLKNASKEELWQQFMNDLHAKAKLEISFDARFADSLRDYFKHVHETFSAS